MLDVWRSLHHQAVLLIVPRHPESFAAVYDYACALGFNTVKRTDESQLNDDVEVIVGDSMGELMSYYLNADIAFVGGSLVDTGCQNVIEPIRCGLPTLFGYSTYNFQSSCALALKVACAKQVFSSQEWKEEVEHLLKLYPFAQCRYLPYDKDNYVRQFLSEHQPTAALFMETEIWANYLVHLHKNHIPSFLLNARLSDKSYLGYQRLASLLAPLISYFSVIFAQDQASADRFRQLGAQQVMVVGNSKQDITIKEEDRARGACFARHKQNLSKAIVIAASTRSMGE